MSDNLPDGWKKVILSDIVEINPESRSPTKENGDEMISYVDIEAVENGSGKIISPKKIRFETSPSRARRVIRKDDVIVSMVRPELKAFAYVPQELDSQICSTGFAVLRGTGKTDPYFLLNVLLSDNVIDQFRKMTVGGQYPSLTQKTVAKTEIILPPLPEQRRIAEILTAADSAIEDAGKTVFDSHQIKTGLMQRLIPRDTNNLPEGWILGKLDDAGTWFAGGTPSRTKPQYYLNGNVPWIKSGDLNDGYVTETEEKITLAATKETRACINKIGSVALALYGATIGKTGIISVEAATNQACCVCTPYPHIDSRFLNAYLISQRNEFRKRGSGGAQSNISKEIVVSYPFPYPSLAEQRRIAGILTAADDQIALCQKRKALLQRTKTGLMQNLLSGAAS